MTLLDALKLGRVSNLPTVWTNALAGALLAGGDPGDARFGLVLLAMTLFYVGGMYLNDAFDAGIDAAERPERPIPSGRVRRSTVFTAGFGMLGLGIALLTWIGFAFQGGTGLAPVLSGAALAGAIVVYDMFHKKNPLSPLIMGVCRMLVYVTAALALTGTAPVPVIIGAVLLLAYLIGLTYTAKQENLGRVETLWPLVFLAAPILYGGYAILASGGSAIAIAIWLLFTLWVAYALRFVFRRGPGDIPRAVVSLIAGISLLDAMMIATTGNAAFVLLAIAAFALTLILQRVVPGT